MDTTVDPGNRSNAALAYWRYAHDHLRAARTLGGRHGLPQADAQPSYHLLAQALEFGLIAFARASGVAVTEVQREYRRDVRALLALGLARGLSVPPAKVQATIVEIARHHQRDRFLHVSGADDELPDFAALYEAVCWVLATIVPAVAQDYVRHYSDRQSPSAESFINRLRADLAATTESSQVALA